METLSIDLGKGVKLQAPIKLDMSLEEWVRMTKYINSILANTPEVKLSESIQIEER